MLSQSTLAQRCLLPFLSLCVMTFLMLNITVAMCTQVWVSLQVKLLIRFEFERWQLSGSLALSREDIQRVPWEVNPSSVHTEAFPWRVETRAKKIYYRSVSASSDAAKDY